MADALRLTYNACDPDKPATTDHYIDCSKARGSGVLRDRFLSHLYRSDEKVRFLFSGHTGCGKSSELEQVREGLLRPEGDHPRYFPVIVNASDYLDEYDVAPVDIFLSIVSELAAALREELGIELSDNYFIKRIEEVKQFFLSDVEMREGELGLGVAKLKIQRLKRDPDARKEVRQKLEPKMPTMAVEINTVFDEARVAIAKKNVKGGSFGDFVLILDNMEKIFGFPGKEEGLTSQRELFIERAPQLTAIKAHVVYTVPLRLVRADGPQLMQRYGVQPFVLPMVKVFERGSSTPFDAGYECIRTLLQKRLGDLSLDEVVAPDALDFLIRYSGGHLRNLMTFVREACTQASSIPIPIDAAKEAIRPTISSYSRAIPEAHWKMLAELDESANQSIPGGDPNYLLMVEQLSVLEYVNGGIDDLFAASEPWYAVNPIVKELQKFKAAKPELSKVSQS